MPFYHRVGYILQYTHHKHIDIFQILNICTFMIRDDLYNSPVVTDAAYRQT